MKTLLILAWRNLWRKKRRTFITVSSVMFAVILTIFLMSIVAGMKEQMVDSIVNYTTGHLQVQDVLYDEEPSIDYALYYGDELKDILSGYSDKIGFIVPRIRNFSLASRDYGTRGVIVTGIVPEKEDKMNNLSSRITEGRMFRNDDDFAVIGEGLAKQLDLSVGDTIVLFGGGFQGMIAAGQYTVGGIIRFSLPEQSNTVVYLPLTEAQYFFAAPNRVTNLIIMLDDITDVDILRDELSKELDEEWFAALTWEELMPDAIAAFDARDAQVKLMSMVLYIVVAFGIFGTVITMMHERMKEFGIVLSIGLQRHKLALICLLETLFMSFIGVIAGVLVGYPLIYRLYLFPIQLQGELAEVMTDMGIEPVFAFSASPEIFVRQAVTVFFVAMIIGLYPVYKVFRLDMVNASRK